MEKDNIEEVKAIKTFSFILPLSLFQYIKAILKANLKHL